MNVSYALDVQFGFTYCNEYSKSVVLKFVAKNVDRIFDGDDDEDPFKKYKDHPECRTLLTKALKLKFKASA